MAKSFFTESVNPYERGFFAEALPRNSESFKNDEFAPQWLKWEDIFERAKQGDFSRTPELIDMLGTMDLTFDSAITQLLAFSGSSTALEAAAALLVGEGSFKHIDLCKALLISGDLRYVPRVVNSYVRLERDGWRELEMIPVLLRAALADPRGTFNDNVPIPEFETPVLVRHQELVRHHESETVCVFRGEKKSPVRFAGMLRRYGGESGGDLGMLRVQFEAFTGIDCSRFFDTSRNPRMLEIAAVAEEFLELPNAESFVEGARYFFGHRISD